VEYLDNKELSASKDRIKEYYSEEQTWPAFNDNFWKKIADVPRDAKVVEAGCGAGWMASKMIDEMNFENITLFDFDDYRQEDSSSKKCDFHTFDFCFDAWPLESESMDVVMSIQVLEHLENPFYYIREARRVLKPGGRLYLSIPNGWSIVSRYMFLRWARLDGYAASNDHISFYSKDVFFEKLLRGFKLMASIFHPRKKLPLPLLRYFKFNYPANETFSRKVLYILEKEIEN
jgi:SAM-dependent methyltransferase